MKFSKFKLICLMLISLQGVSSLARASCGPIYEIQITEARNNRNLTRCFSMLLVPLPLTGPIWLSQNASIGTMNRAQTMLKEAEHGWGTNLEEMYTLLQRHHSSKLTQVDFKNIIHWADQKNIFCPTQRGPLATRRQILQMIITGNLVKIYLDEKENKLQGVPDTDPENTTKLTSQDLIQDQSQDLSQDQFDNSALELISQDSDDPTTPLYKKLDSSMGSD